MMPELKIDISSNKLYALETFISYLSELLHIYRIVLIIDELETLSENDNKNFDNILQLLNINKKGFVKIGISNTLNLFAQAQGKQIPLNFTFMTFKPYTIDQLVDIIK